MRNKEFLHPATCFFLLTLLVVCISWVGSIYTWKHVQNLLSAEGLRWLLRYTGDSFTRSSVTGAVLLLFLGGGLCLHSGLLDACRRFVICRRKLSRKEYRGLFYAWIVGGIYIMLWLFLAWGPVNLVRSATGTLPESPLVDGLFYVTSVGLGITGTVYGFVTDLYKGDTDVIQGMAYLFRSCSVYFVTLFFVIQFFAVFQYSGVYLFLSFPPLVWKVIYYLCCLFPLWYCWERGKTRN